MDKQNEKFYIDGSLNFNAYTEKCIKITCCNL